MKKKTSSPKTAESGKLKKALSCWQLYILLIPALIWLIVFAYYPMYGLIIAFKDFKGRMGIIGSPWQIRFSSISRCSSVPVLP